MCFFNAITNLNSQKSGSSLKRIIISLIFQAGVYSINKSRASMRAFAFLGVHTQEAKFVVAPRVQTAHPSKPGSAHRAPLPLVSKAPRAPCHLNGRKYFSGPVKRSPRVKQPCAGPAERRSNALCARCAQQPALSGLLQRHHLHN